MTAHDEFLMAASVPREGAHVSGTLDTARQLLASHPEIAGASMQAAAVLGDADRIRDLIAQDPEAAVRAGGPYGWDPLTWLCFSRYLRLERDRAPSFLRAATLLLDAGADANTGWDEGPPYDTRESVIYATAALAGDADITRLLLERGADPNDDETPYHVPESYEHGPMVVLLESGRLTEDSLATMLLRKADVHDTAGMKLLLEHGADPNRKTRWGFTAIEQALRRDNSLEAVALLFDHAVDARLPGLTGSSDAAAIAAERGRGDVLRLFAQRGVTVHLHGVHRLLAACALGDDDHARALVDAEPALGTALAAMQGQALAEFAGNDNVAGLRCLMALGAPADARHAKGDAYFGVAPASTALHVAAWRASHAAVASLLDAGADANARDGVGRSPLELAIRACVDSYWKARRAPDSVARLLAAGASRADVALPTGYDAIDELLRA